MRSPLIPHSGNHCSAVVWASCFLICSQTPPCWGLEDPFTAWQGQNSRVPTWSCLAWVNIWSDSFLLAFVHFCFVFLRMFAITNRLLSNLLLFWKCDLGRFSWVRLFYFCLCSLAFVSYQLLQHSIPVLMLPASLPHFPLLSVSSCLFIDNVHSFSYT